MVQENETIRRLKCKIKKLSRYVEDKKLVIEQLKKKYEYRNEPLNKGILIYIVRIINNGIRTMIRNKPEIEPKLPCYIQKLSIEAIIMMT